MHRDWPPSGPYDDRAPWPPYLPKKAAAGFPPIGVGGFGHPDVQAGMWARATLDDAHRYFQSARQCLWANWAIERGEDWSPDEAQFRAWTEVMWVDACRLG